MKKEFKIILLSLLGIFFILVLSYIYKQYNNAEIEIDEPLIVPQAAEISEADLGSVSGIVAHLSANYKLVESTSLEARELEVIRATELLSLADFAYLNLALLKDLGIEAGVIRYDYEDNSNLVVVLRNEDSPQYIVYTKDQAILYESVWSFSDIIRAEELRLGVKIDRYAYFPGETKDFSEVLELYPWNNF